MFTLADTLEDLDKTYDYFEQIRRLPPSQQQKLVEWLTQELKHDQLLGAISASVAQNLDAYRYLSQ